MLQVDIPTFGEIVADLRRRGFELRSCKGSHAKFVKGGRSVIVCIKHWGGHPYRHTYKTMCKRLGFEPGRKKR